MPEFPQNLNLNLPTYLHDGDTPLSTEHEGMMLLPRGTGLISADGTRYRVVDTWFCLERHSRMEYGFHVFLERVHPGSGDDRPKRLHPTYYRDDPEPVFDRVLE